MQPIRQLAYCWWPTSRVHQLSAAGVLQEFEAKGGKLEKPVGCKDLEDWLLDAISVRELLRRLGSGIYISSTTVAGRIHFWQHLWREDNYLL